MSTVCFFSIYYHSHFNICSILLIIKHVLKYIDIFLQFLIIDVSNVDLILHF